MCRPVFDETIILKDNAMLKHRPELFNEWDFEKNDELGLDVYNMTKGMKKIVWWKCIDCENTYSKDVKHRVRGRGCSYCGKYNKKTLKGFNDIWTTNPKLAELLENGDDGYIYTQSSNKKVSWKCPNCELVIFEKRIADVNRRGVCCANCGDGKSYPEKFIFNLLTSMDISFRCEEIFEWSKGKRYDFYLINYNTIIEVNGIQHYEGIGFSGFGGRTVLDEINNDNYKKHLAISNNIYEYYIIDARESTLEHMRESILNSKLSHLFTLDDVRWESIHNKSLDSLIKKTAELWEEYENTNIIKDILKISRSTVISYLKKASEIGWCNYNPNKEMKIAGLSHSIEVVQLDKNNNKLNDWKSISEASRSLDICNSSIAKSCKGKRKTCGGFKWMYKEDYDELKTS